MTCTRCSEYSGSEARTCLGCGKTLCLKCWHSNLMAGHGDRCDVAEAVNRIRRAGW